MFAQDPDIKFDDFYSLRNNIGYSLIGPLYKCR